MMETVNHTENETDDADDVLENVSLEETIESIFAPKARENPVYIDDLADAIVIGEDGIPTLTTDKSGLIVIEKWYGERWMGTLLYKVLSVNPISGDMRLHDESNQQAAMANFLTGPKKYGWRFKLPIPGLNLNKREAPRLQPTSFTGKPSVPQADEHGNLIPKKNGRPKGSKNRSPEEIAADNAVKAAEKRAKKEARLNKKNRAA